MNTTKRVGKKMQRSGIELLTTLTPLFESFSEHLTFFCRDDCPYNSHDTISYGIRRCFFFFANVIGYFNVSRCNVYSTFIWYFRSAHN